ncbi:MAG: hypothetical protein H0V09_10275, partial [Gemmatimonadetes bacterium]|nr:hypothetical protein [Gemmatimonadota bacterium]
MTPAVAASTLLGLGRWPWGPGTLTSGAVTLAAFAAGPPAPSALAFLGVAVGAAAVPLAGA